MVENGTYEKPSICNKLVHNSLHILKVKIGNQRSVLKIMPNQMNIISSTSAKNNYISLGKRIDVTTDTIVLSKGGQSITSNAVTKFVDTLPDVFIVQRCVFFSHPAPDSNLIRQVITKSSGLTRYYFSALFYAFQEWVPDRRNTCRMKKERS
jgi:hypothetical protein